MFDNITIQRDKIKKTTIEERKEVINEGLAKNVSNKLPQKKEKTIEVLLKDKLQLENKVRTVNKKIEKYEVEREKLESSIKNILQNIKEKINIELKKLSRKD